jgi:hypothetical protein
MPFERAELRDALLVAARADERITGVAMIGSAAIDREDAWSDLDLAFAVAESDLEQTRADWTAALYRDHGAVHHVELPGGSVLFLLPSTLQVDLVFTPAERFGPAGPKFRLIAGGVGEAAGGQLTPPTVDQLAGLAWVYAIQVRSCLGRRRNWQALRMLGELRDRVMNLVCLREGLPAVHGVGFDLLPEPVLDRFRACHPAQPAEHELRRAFAASITLLLEELKTGAPELHGRLEAPLRVLAGA